MFDRNGVSRRGFVGGVASAVAGGYLGMSSPTDRLLYVGREPVRLKPPAPRGGGDPYDLLAKLHFNENPYGPPESVLKAMTQAFKYANRYGYPDGDIVQEIAKHHGVKTEQIVLGAGSGEILDVVGSAFAANGKKVLGVAPSYGFVYSHVSSVMGASITLPLTADYQQDIPALIRAAKRHYRELGFVYVCNPNNPTGRIVTKQEVAQLLDGLPEDLPVLIDEAYFHFVEDPSYATAIPHVNEGRPVIVTRTFSKIAALAGMRLGYAVAPPELIQRITPYISDSINAVVKWGGVAALKDTESQARVKRVTLQLRKQTVTELSALGYDVVPSETNFFMVHLGRRVEPVIREFEKRGVLVGRPFPPMVEHLRVSVGTADEMHRFTIAFKEIMAQPASSS
jgi:histidinol-phosphate aminotransferase